MGAEDFADYTVPGCMMLLGVKSPREKITPLHTSTFKLDEKALLLGVRLFTQILLKWPCPNWVGASLKVA
jgi:amidohydrolase